MSYPLADYTRAIEIGPPAASMYRSRASAYSQLGRFEEAIDDARRSLSLNPDYRSAYEVLFRALLATSPIETAQAPRPAPDVEAGPSVILRAELEEFGKRANGWFDVERKAYAYMTIGDYYRQLKEYDLAMKWVERAIQEQPDDFRGFMYRARIHKELGDDDAVEADCDTAEGIELDEPQDLGDRAWYLERQCNRRDRAIEDLDRVIELAPKWHVAYADRGRVYYISKRYDEAMADCDKATELAPLDAWPYRLRAAVHGDLGQLDQSAEQKERSLELDPHNPWGWTNYGNDLRALGRIEEAITAIKRAIELNPRLAYAHASLANTLPWLGRCDEAMAELLKAQEIAPAEPTIHANISYAHLSTFFYNCPDRSNLDQAVRSARLAAERPRFRGNLAAALFRTGDYVEARRIYLELFEENPNTLAWFTLAMTLWHLDERAEAAAAVRLVRPLRSWLDSLRVLPEDIGTSCSRVHSRFIERMIRSTMATLAGSGELRNRRLTSPESGSRR